MSQRVAFSVVAGVCSDRAGTCAGCQRTQSHVAILIEGPRLSLCDRCVGAAAVLIRMSRPPWRIDVLDRRSAPRPERCSFCGTGSGRVGEPVLLTEGSICRDCVELCTRLLLEARGRSA